MLRLVLCLCWIPLLSAQDAGIRGLLRDSVVAWNNGDLERFASFYEDSPETTFIGSEVVRGGVADILGRYKRRYPNRETMGALTFSNIEVRILTAEIGLVTGEFHLERSPAGGGNASGRYTLIVRRTTSGWKIIHDHTS